MKHIETFMGHIITYDPVEDRRQLQGKAKRGEITPRGFLANLKASWYQMNDQDKAEELIEIE